jgi:hypothetical protein
LSGKEGRACRVAVAVLAYPFLCNHIRNPCCTLSCFHASAMVSAKALQARPVQRLLCCQMVYVVCTHQDIDAAKVLLDLLRHLRHCVAVVACVALVGGHLGG